MTNEPATITPPAGTTLIGALPPGGKSLRCERPDGTLHGPAIFWQALNSQLVDGKWTTRSAEVHGAWKDGKRHGREVARCDERLWWEGEFVDGEKHGEWRTFDDAGTEVVRHDFDHGVLRTTVTPELKVRWQAGVPVSIERSLSEQLTAPSLFIENERVDEAALLARKPDRLTVHGSAIPDVVWQLTSLKQLSLQGPLTDVPAGIGQLENLEWLSIASTRIATLPAAMGQLRKLKTAVLSSNRLVGLPAELAQLPALETLTLSHNPLFVLPDALSDCRSLRLLQLDQTSLESLPRAGLHVTSLSIDNGRDGRWGQLRSLPEALTQHALVGLTLRGLAITELPDGLRATNSLSVNGCALLRLPRLGDGMAACQVSFRDNAVDQLPLHAGEWKVFKLTLDGNPLTQWPAELERKRATKAALSQWKKQQAVLEKGRLSIEKGAVKAAAAKKKAAAKPKPRSRR